MQETLQAARVDYGQHETALQAYLRDGESRAMELGNRGPIRLDRDGALHPDIAEAYWRNGFYVFEDVLQEAELADIEADVQEILSRLPVAKDSDVDALGRPALGADCEAPTLFWAKPLGDPFGGTEEAAGRHPVKMIEPEAAPDAPEDVVYLILGSLQFSEACLRVYGHPELLAVAAAINGDDFVPFTEALFLKEPGRGASVAWHQDGVTHWDSPTWDEGSHGFNFMAQLYGCTAANGVWVLPGSHRLGKVDIAALVDESGSDRIQGAVPILCRPGDVAITNRQVVHGSFANTSTDWRVTVNFGFHRRASVLGVTTGGLHNAVAHYDDARIRTRSRLIGYAIDARGQRYPDETPYVYKPLADAGESCRWTEAAKAGVKDYNLLDLGL